MVKVGSECEGGHQGCLEEWKVTVWKLVTAVDKEGWKPTNMECPVCVKLRSYMPAFHPDADANEELCDSPF